VCRQEQGWETLPHGIQTVFIFSACRPLQNSLGSFPLPPPIFPGVQQMRPLGPHPSMFGQPAGRSHCIVGFLLNPVLLMQMSLHLHMFWCIIYTGSLLIPPQGFGPLHWGMQFPHQGQPFYGGTFPGARAPGPSAASGSHNQFVPLQVRS